MGKVPLPKRNKGGGFVDYRRQQQANKFIDKHAPWIVAVLVGIIAYIIVSWVIGKV